MASRLPRTSSSISQALRYTSLTNSFQSSVLRRAFHGATSHSQDDKGLTSNPVSQKPGIPDQTPSLPSFSLLHQIRDAHPAVRYTVYAGLGLMVTVESTFWYNVIKAKFFPSASEEEQAKAEEFMESVRKAIAGYKTNWVRNYGRYYGGYVWGVGER
jgi:hypothetical protein